MGIRPYTRGVHMAEQPRIDGDRAASAAPRTNFDAGVYQIVNTVNNKRYIGSASNLNKRERAHFNSLARGGHHNRHLQHAYTKYGAHAFRFEVLFYVNKGWLERIEQLCLDTMRPEYNIAPTANNMLGYRHTYKSKEKMRRSHIGIGAGIGYRHSEATKQKIGRGNLGKRRSRETIERIRQVKTGFSWGTHTDEAKRRNSEANKATKNIGRHTRWHINRGLVSDTCEFCGDGV